MHRLAQSICPKEQPFTSCYWSALGSVFDSTGVSVGAGQFSSVQFSFVLFEFEFVLCLLCIPPPLYPIGIGCMM